MGTKRPIRRLIRDKMSSGYIPSVMQSLFPRSSFTNNSIIAEYFVLSSYILSLTSGRATDYLSAVPLICQLTCRFPKGRRVVAECEDSGLKLRTTVAWPIGEVACNNTDLIFPQAPFHALFIAVPVGICSNKNVLGTWSGGTACDKVLIYVWNKQQFSMSE